MSRYPDIAETEGNGHGTRIADIEQLITSMTPLSGKDLERAKETLTEAGSEIAERARRSARATNSYVHENPWQSVGIGAILGLLVGIAVSRRM